MIAILAIFQISQMIQKVHQKPTPIAAITPQNNQQMMKNILILKDKDYIDSCIHSINYFLISLLYNSFFF
jgi:hypothetical protein